jgi:hypothetical protein
MKQYDYWRKGARIDKYDVDEGDEVVLDWDPYGWAMDELGATSPVSGVISNISGVQEPRHICDVTIDVDGFEGTLTVHLDNGYVTTGIGGSPFDKGRFLGFYKTDR